MSFKSQFVGLRFVGGQKCEERGGMCAEVEDDEAPGTNNEAGDNDENDQGAKINHVCSSVKHDRSMVDQNFRTQSKFSHGCWTRIICFISHKRTDMPH